MLYLQQSFSSDDDEDEEEEEGEAGPSSPNRKCTHIARQQKADGNVVLLSLGKLAEEPNLMTGDPLRCCQCEAVLSSTSKLTQQPDDHKKTWTWSVIDSSFIHLHIHTGTRRPQENPDLSPSHTPIFIQQPNNNHEKPGACQLWIPPFTCLYTHIATRLRGRGGGGGEREREARRGQ